MMNDTMFELQLSRGNTPREYIPGDMAPQAQERRFFPFGNPFRKRRVTLRMYVERAMVNARVEYLSEDDEYYGSIPGFEGLFGTGETRDECEQDLREALATWVKVRVTRGLPLPQLG